VSVIGAVSRIYISDTARILCPFGVKFITDRSKNKVKVVPVFKHHAMTTYGGVEI
jgi:hypothetical protein